MSHATWMLAQTRDRLLSRITVLDNGCWQWGRFVNNGGYGLTSYRGRRGTPVHRAFYMEFVGPIPEGLEIDHLCHNRDTTCRGGPTCPHRRCVNPEHLEPATSEVNSRRARDGRPDYRPPRNLKTHCPARHEYAPENTRTYGTRRFCIACQKAKDAVRVRNRKAARR